MRSSDLLRLSDGVVLRRAGASTLPREDDLRLVVPAGPSPEEPDAPLSIDLDLAAAGLRREDVAARLLLVDEDDAAGAVLAAVAGALWTGADPFAPAERSRVAGVVTTLALTWLVPELLRQTGGRSAVRLAAVLDVWTHLKDSDLSVATIARRTGVSERSLYAAFSDGPERLGALLRRLREDRAAAELESLPERGDVDRTVARRWLARPSIAGSA